MSTPIIHSELTPIINSELPLNEPPKCCKNYYPRVPYTYINYLIDDCITSPYTGDWDILCCIPMIFGCYKVNIHCDKSII